MTAKLEQSNGPRLAHPDGLTLPAAADELLARLFAGHTRVVIEAEFGGGYSGSRVFKVIPYRDADTPELPAVVKLAPAGLIDQEYRAYQRFIRGRLSGVPEIWGEPVFTTDGAWGGLRYSLIGSGLFNIESLARYCAHASAQDIVHVLESRLFVHLGAIWRQAKPAREVQLADAGYANLISDRALIDIQTAFGGTVDVARDPLATPHEAPPSPVPTGEVGRGGEGRPLPNPLAAVPRLLHQLRDIRIATIHGDLNLENILVDPEARTIRLIDFAQSREDHVLHDLLRLETGILTRLLPDALAQAALPPEVVHALLLQLHHDASAEPPHPALRTLYVMLITLRKAAAPLLAQPDDWSEYYDGLTVYLLGASKYRNLDASAKQVAFWAAASAQQLARTSPRANRDALDAAIAVLLSRNPVLEAYRQGRIAEWSGPRYELDDRFVELALLVDQGEESASGRWQARQEHYPSLRALLAAVPDPALVLLGPPGSGKSTLLRHLELDTAIAALTPITFFIQLNTYKPTRPGDPLAPPDAWLAERWAARFPRMPGLDELLGEGRMILLLDALNEMPAASEAEFRARVGLWKDWLVRLVAERPGNRVVFSCRTLDYSAPLSTPVLRVPQVQIEPLGDEQVADFLRLYSPQQGEAVWQALAGTEQLEALRSPYFLGLLVEQVEATGEIAPDRAALFTGFVRQALKREVERDNPLFAPDGLLASRDVRRLTQWQWSSAYELPERGILLSKLAALAYGMQAASADGGASQVRVGYDEALELLGHEREEDILKAGLAIAVLDEDPAADEVLYRHQLIQEYFAARKLVRSPDPELVRTEWRAAEISPSVRELVERLLDELRWALVARSRDPAADLRDRIACGLAVGDLGDPRFERRVGPRGEYLLPPLVEIPGGVYPIGDDEPIEWAYIDNSGTFTGHIPRHEVQIAPFRIGQFPVTNAGWACFMAAGGYEDERWWDTAGGRTWRRGELANEAAKHSSRQWRKRFQDDPTLLEQMVEEGRFANEEHLARWRHWMTLDDEAFERALDLQWQAKRETAPRYWHDPRYNRPTQPVVGICWYEARAYCAWLAEQTGLDVRLPTEVEWEAAARGREGRRYAFGEEFDPLKGNTLETRLKRNTPVGVFPDGDTPEEVCDMAGNVDEWTSSLFGEGEDEPDFRYPYDPADGREDAEAPPAVQRVVRGGSWFTARDGARAAGRGNYQPGYPFFAVACRVVVGVGLSQIPRVY